MQDISEDVISRAAQGDTAAFEEIMRGCGDFVFNVCLRMLRHREDAEEATQEVFFSAYQKLRYFEMRSSLKTWLYRIAVNTSLNYLKRASNLKNRTVTYEEGFEVEAPGNEVREKADREHAEYTAGKLLDLLTDEQRTCVVLRSVEGLSYEDIAQTLGVDINVVRSRLKRARDKMMAAKHEVMSHDM